MSTWTAPITWANAAVTAAQMNAEIRDHCTFLKGALDVITNSTTADTGTTTYLNIIRPAAGNPVFTCSISGDSNPRHSVAADGGLRWDYTADGTYDAYLTSTAAGALVVSANGTANATKFEVQSTAGQQSRLWVDVAGDNYARCTLAGDATQTGIFFGPGDTSADTYIERAGADTLRSPDGARFEGGIVTKIKAGTPTDADLATDMQQVGAIIVDTTASKIWVRTAAATWKYVTLT